MASENCTASSNNRFSANAGRSSVKAAMRSSQYLQQRRTVDGPTSSQPSGLSLGVDRPHPNSSLVSWPIDPNCGRVAGFRRAHP